MKNRYDDEIQENAYHCEWCGKELEEPTFWCSSECELLCWKRAEKNDKIEREG